MNVDAQNSKDLKAFIHPFEKPRIAHYRDHGFDNMDNIYSFVSQLLNNHPNDYSNTFQSQKHFLSISISNTLPLHREVTITVGYIDYQDKERFIMGSITLAYLPNFNTVAVISSRGENNIVSLDIEDILLEIQHKNYISLYKHPALQ